MALEKVVLDDYILCDETDVKEEKYIGFVHDNEHYIFDAEDLFKEKPLPIAGRDMFFSTFVYRLLSYDSVKLQATCEKINDTLDVQRICYTFFKYHQPSTRQILGVVKAGERLQEKLGEQLDAYLAARDTRRYE